ncbi:MAG: NAD(P)H-dependent oxidoreductase subunit E [Planctomycetaceae bacterium]|nr:NAD(P)H-dependent oxidoreductase subunit E [Planctomycetaceae bacterium]
MTEPKPQIVVCLGSSCFAKGNNRIVELTEQYLCDHGYQNDADVRLSGSLCQEHCSEGPNVMIDNVFYSQVDSGVMLDILKKVLPPKH